MTLTSLGPIYSIPLLFFMKNELTSPKASFGSCLTICGIVLLSYLTLRDNLSGSGSEVSNLNNTVTNYSDFEISTLPGWYDVLPSKQYSGYFNKTSVSKDLNLHSHFWFIESEVQDQDNLILWFNGGPGASSVYGNLLEIGPFMLSDLSFLNQSYKDTGIPQLIYNQYGWQKIANLLFISMPPPIGYGYCSPISESDLNSYENNTANGASCGDWNDTSTAEITYDTIRQFLTAFHPWRNSTMYITGNNFILFVCKGLLFSINLPSDIAY